MQLAVFENKVVDTEQVFSSRSREFAGPDAFVGQSFRRFRGLSLKTLASWRGIPPKDTRRDTNATTCGGKLMLAARGSDGGIDELIAKIFRTQKRRQRNAGPPGQATASLIVFNTQAGTSKSEARYCDIDFPLSSVQKPTFPRPPGCLFCPYFFAKDECLRGQHLYHPPEHLIWTTRSASAQ